MTTEPETAPVTDAPDAETAPKKKSGLPLILLAVLCAAAAVGVFLLLPSASTEPETELPVVWTAEGVTVAAADGEGHLLGTVEGDAAKAAVLSAEDGSVIAEVPGAIAPGRERVRPTDVAVLPGGGFAWLGPNAVAFWRPDSEPQMLAAEDGGEGVIGSVRVEGETLKWMRYPKPPEGGDTVPPDFWQADLKTLEVEERGQEGPDFAGRMGRAAPNKGYGFPQETAVSRETAEGDLVAVEWSRPEGMDAVVFQRATTESGLTVFRKADGKPKRLGGLTFRETETTFLGKTFEPTRPEPITGFALDDANDRIYVSHAGATTAYDLSE